MAKKVEKNEDEGALGGVQKLKSLKIKNFRSIKEEIFIELDEIVVLVGPNNTGKSSILKAYDIIMKHGSKDCFLGAKDFHRENQENPIEITLETYIDPNAEKAPAKQWHISENENVFVREKWVWVKPGEPKRMGYIEGTGWDEKVPWGAPAVANSNRPYPHRVDAFDDPENQVNEIKEIVSSIVKDKIANIADPDDASKTAISVITEKLAAFKKLAADQTDDDLSEIETGISEIISEVFPKYELKIQKIPGADADLLKGKSSVVSFDSDLKMGKQDGENTYLSSLEVHGSGARRTLLWSALKYIREHNRGKVKVPNERSHVLLLDEPEICLHPSAIRHAANVLYDLPQGGRWQVMLTTHCPLFIDLSRDNTTIIRVESDDDTGHISGTTLYRPSRVMLSPDEKELLKLLNLYDPYFAEFFFSKKILVVEGDTEYAAFKYLRALSADYNDLHIIRARSKAGIVAVSKILNQFNACYSILHDSDYPLLESTNVNPAWTTNLNIKAVVDAGIQQGAKINLYASKKNFEHAFLTEEVKKDKPFNAIQQIKSNEALKATLDDSLNRIMQGLPGDTKVCKWNTLKDLEDHLKS